MCAELHWQVRDAVALVMVPFGRGPVAVTVVAPAVAPLHVASPKVWSGALLILTFTVSVTDQVTLVRMAGGGTHPVNFPSAMK